MPVGARDRQVLRELASQVAEIAALPIQQETIRLWKALNGLKPVRPMVMIDQVPWHEMEVGEELLPRCEDEFCRSLEISLRRTLYAWRHMRADMVVEPVVEIPKVIKGESFGVAVQERIAITDPRNEVVGHAYYDQMQTEEDLRRIREPQVELDERATAERQEKAQEIFDGLLTVQMQGRFPVFAPWDIITTWRSPERVLVDLVERPDFMHRLIARLTEVHLSLLDQLEAQGLLGTRQRTIHCTGAYTDELPAPGYDPARPRAKDLWTYAMAQVFGAVSPAMHKEFWLDYARPWFARFGLVYYGCCEPLHEKIPLIREMPNVRKISMSPWVDQEKGAQRIGRDFVFSRKPNPALLAAETWDPEQVRADLKQTVEICARYGCPLEIIMKDISTVRYQPQRLWEFAEIARSVVGA